MIRALVVYPDTPCHGELLRSLAQEPRVTVVADCVCVDDALAKIDSLRPDVVFAGVEAYPGGLSALHWPASAKHPYVVVLSESGRHALEAFAINAVDYLLMPLEPERLKNAIYRLHRNLEADQLLDRRLDLDTLVHYLKGYVGKAPPERPQQDDRVAINFGGRFRFLSMRSIRYIQADADYVDIHMVTGEVLHSTSRISEMSTKLPADRFLRIRRSTIVNVEHVREARAHKENYEIVMDDDATFRPGTTYKSKVRAALVKGFAAANGGRSSALESPT